MKDDMKIEMEAHSEQQLKRIVEHMDNMARLSNDTVQELTLQNTRLQSELNKAIHKLCDYEKTLKIYATGKFDPNRFEAGDYAYATDIRALDNGDLARETLKKWEDK